jgi:hypothetical protein
LVTFLWCQRKVTTTDVSLTHPRTPKALLKIHFYLILLTKLNIRLQEVLLIPKIQLIRVQKRPC